MAIRNRSRQIQSDTQLLQGIQQHYASTSFSTHAGPVTAARVADAVTARNATADAVVKASLAYHAAVLADAQQVASSEALLRDVRQGILATFPSPDVLADCGLAERKPRRPLTPEASLVRAAKVKATRLARATMSAKRRARIKGTVPAALTVATDV